MVAGLLDSKLVSGKKTTFSVEVSDNNVTVKDSNTVSANTGKSTSVITTTNTLSYTTYEGGSELSTSSSVSATEGKSYFAPPTSTLTANHTTSTATHDYGATMTETVQDSLSYNTANESVAIKQSSTTTYSATDAVDTDGAGFGGSSAASAAASTARAEDRDAFEGSTAAVNGRSATTTSEAGATYSNDDGGRAGQSGQTVQSTTGAAAMQGDGEQARQSGQTVQSTTGAAAMQGDGEQARQSGQAVQSATGATVAQDDGVKTGKSKQVTQFIKDNVEFEGLELAKKESSVSTSTSVWESESRVEFANGSAESKVSVLNAEAHAGTEVKGTLGKDFFEANAKAGASVSVLETSSDIQIGAVTAKTEGSVLKAEAHASAGVKVGLDGIEAAAKVGASVTVAEAKGTVSVGDGNLGLEVGVEGKVLSAAADAGAKIGYAKNEKTGQYELNAYASAEVNAVLAEGKVSGKASIGGVDVGGTAGVYIGAGAKVKVGVENNKFVFEVGAALGIGVNFKITIGFNDQFLKNINNFLSRPGVAYASASPYFKADTVKLRNYATRINNVNNRLRRLDSDLRSLYWQVGFLDLYDIMVANLLTSGSPTLTQIKSYLENAATSIEAADNKARGYMGG